MLLRKILKFHRIAYRKPNCVCLKTNAIEADFFPVLVAKHYPQHPNFSNFILGNTKFNKDYKH